ncbi:MAG: C10 family peptidase [Bacteroidales bacterium]|nr:C10 family peptidase [Bacteroidales bacterium]
MKRFVLFLFLVLPVAISCDGFASESVDGECLVSSGQIAVRSGSADVASDSMFVSQKMAELFISSQKDNPSIINIEPYELDGVVCFYVINFEKGYKIVAADTRVQPILAECEEGNLSPDKTDNPGVKVWLEDTADRIRVLKRFNLSVEEDYSDLWSPFRDQKKPSIRTRAMRDSSFFDEEYIWIRVVETNTVSIYSNADQPALMTTKWGQGYPWNATMPNDYLTGVSCLTGCASVAVSQVLRYFNKKGDYPTALYHSVSVNSVTPLYVPGLNWFIVETTLSRSGYTSSSSRWSNMPDTRSGSHTSYVSRLMLDIGNRVDMHYCQYLSYVEPGILYSIPNLPQCGISSSYAPYNFSTVAADIRSKKPVIVSAYTDSTQTGLSGGHTWVIDGCHDYLLYYFTTETYYHILSADYYSYSNVVDVYTESEMMTVNPNVYDGMQNVTSSSHTMKDLHMNWGWDGDGDGNYNMLSSNNWIVPSGGSTLNYLYERRMHHNISTTQLY